MFQFKREIRPFVENLTKLMCYANGETQGNWSSDVFNHAYKALQAIVKEECGEWVKDELPNEVNFGGGRSFMEDVEDAITQIKAERYTIYVECEGNAWYIHEKGERIYDRGTARRFDKPTAKVLAEVVAKTWKATTQLHDTM